MWVYAGKLWPNEMPTKAGCIDSIPSPARALLDHNNIVAGIPWTNKGPRKHGEPRPAQRPYIRETMHSALNE